MAGTVFRHLTLGRFVPGDSLIHRLEPRVKIVLATVIFILPLLTQEYLSYLFQAAFQCVAFLAAGLPLGGLWRSLRPLFVIMFVTGLIVAISTEGIPAGAVGPFTFTQEGIRLALSATCRALLLLGAGLILVMTTSPLSFTDGLLRLLRPVAFLGLPAEEFAVMTTVAIRFVPVLFEEAERIRRAQLARGAAKAAWGLSGDMSRHFRNTTLLVTALFQGAIRRAEELAIAMDARCYSPGRGRVPSREYTVGRREVIAAVAVMLLTAVSLWTEVSV